VAFSEGRERIIITKPSIAGFGLNWQHCARCAFVGLSFSYESYYQAIRRFWRFGQQRPVQVHIALADTEAVIWNTIQRKARDHETMKVAMNAAMKLAVQEHSVKMPYNPRQVARIPNWCKA
jgi:recombinational DNA repair protein (RecF pathway)